MAEGLMNRANEDRFANVAAIQVTESAANTITWQEKDFGIGIGSGVGILIDGIEYTLASDPAGVDGDGFMMGLSLTNDLVSIEDEFDNPRLLHFYRQVIQMQTSGKNVLAFPIAYQFTPPLITALNGGKLYFGIIGVSQASAIVGQCRIYFRYIPLRDRDYLELAEAFQLFG